MAFRLGGGGAVTFRSAAPVARRDARLAAPLARLARVAVHPRAVALVRRDLRVSASFTETHARPRFPVSRHQGGGTKVPLTGALGDFASYFFLKTRRPSAVAARARASSSQRFGPRFEPTRADRPQDPPVPFICRGAVATAARMAAFAMASLVFFATKAARPAAAGAATAASAALETAAMRESTGAVLGTVVLLFIYAFFCFAETAITTLWPWKVREISDQEGPDSPFTELRKDITRFLTTILIGSTCSSIGSAALATEAALRLYGEPGVGYVTLALTLVTLVMCEIAPKSYAVQHATAVARVVIRPIACLSILVYPLGKICTGIVNGMFKLLNIQGSAEPFVSEEELRLVLSGAAKSGQVDLGEQEMIQNVLEMGETPVREVMTPLVRVVGVESRATLSDLRNLYREHKYSRVPVYDDRVDNIVGVVNSMRMLDADSLDEASLQSTAVSSLPGFGESPYFVPESMSVVKLMRELLARKTHMCIVVNEFGGTIGIATFEDCVEEIVGEIYDETDTPDEIESSETYLTSVAPGVFDVDYRCDVEDLADRIGVDIPSSALYDTVGGFACDCFDRIPEIGESMVVTLPVKAGASWDEMDDDGAERRKRDAKEKNGDSGGSIKTRGASSQRRDAVVHDGRAERAMNDASKTRFASDVSSNESSSDVSNGGGRDRGNDEPKDERDVGFGMTPVRLTVTDGDAKMVRRVRVRVGDCAMEENAAERDTADAVALAEGSPARVSLDISLDVSLDDGDLDALDLISDVAKRKNAEKQSPPR